CPLLTPPWLFGAIRSSSFTIWKRRFLGGASDGWGCSGAVRSFFGSMIGLLEKVLGSGNAYESIATPGLVDADADADPAGGGAAGAAVAVVGMVAALDWRGPVFQLHHLA